MFNYKETAEKILTYSPSSVCKYKILTEILNIDTNLKEIKKLRQQVNESKWVKDIVNYLNYLGLKRGDNSVNRVCNYMESLLNVGELSD